MAVPKTVEAWHRVESRPDLVAARHLAVDRRTALGRTDVRVRDPAPGSSG
ncbi:hypothetical protein ACIA98_00295 [Streptomyces sp. NPDC051366]